MISLKTYLTESASEEKLTHLEHAEDHHINSGREGFKHAFNTLHQTHQMLTGKKSEASISTKYDGSPSIVFGHHPDTGKFFVASKSAFNKTPKLNFTHADIEKNHGHAPGLVSKLKAALTHLPKVAPKEGIYQGDFMYHKDDGDVKEDKSKFHFKPNTITYSTAKDSDEGKKIAKSKIGVVVHTAYKGDSMDSMKAHYNADTSNFAKHQDVHLISSASNHKQAEYKPEDQEKFKQHIQKAVDAESKLKNYNHLAGHQEHLKTYINKTVRTGESPSIAGYTQHLSNHFNTKAMELKTQAGKSNQLAKGQVHIQHVAKHNDAFHQTLEVHKHLQNAKNVLVNALSTHPMYNHHVGKQQVKPEGHVVVIKNRPTKLVDRNEFSKLNFLARS